jgi:NADH-quinone oxidoreductase subunit M
MLTLILLIIPFITGCFLLLRKDWSQIKAFTVIVAAFELLLTFWLVWGNNEPSQTELNINWLPAMIINFHIGVDGLGKLMLLLTNLLSFVIYLTIDSQRIKKLHNYLALLLLAQFGLIGVFVSLNAILFYIFWEIALLPVFFLIVIWGEGSNKVQVTVKFFIYTLVGSLLMLAGFILLYNFGFSNGSFELSQLLTLKLDAHTQSWMFWFMFLAFAIKMPIFPLHSWQPDTYTSAPLQATMVLSGIMLKMGVFGFIRWLMPIFPQAIAEYRYLIMALAITGTLYAAIIALKQKDIKTLFAFASLSHVGLMGAALMASSVYSLQGIMIQMFAHGVNIVGLFFLVDIIEKRTGTRQIGELGGIRSAAPLFSALFLIIVLGNVALPLTNAFVGEFLMFVGIWQINIWLMLIAGLSIIFGAVYMLYAYQKICLGELNNKTQSFSDLSLQEKTVLIPISILIILTGIMPQPLLNLTESLVNEIIGKF